MKNRDSAAPASIRLRLSVVLIGGLIALVDSTPASAGDTTGACSSGAKQCALVDVCTKWNAQGECIEATPSVRYMPIQPE